MYRDPPVGQILLPLLLAVLFSGLCVAQPARATDPDTSAVQHRIDRLNERLDRLEQRVRDLEQHDAAAARSSQPAVGEQKGEKKPQTPTANPPEKGPREAWQSVHSDMPAEEVRKLLGEPMRRFQLGNKMVWYYIYPGVGRGSVMFDQSGHVVDWQRPPFGWW